MAVSSLPRNNSLPDSPRLYTIRKAKEDGSVITIGEFQGYSSKAEAQKAIKEFDRF